jgi:modulator of drug activity B
MKKAMLINAHQFYEGISSGELNKTMLVVIQTELEQYGYEVQRTDIEQGYKINNEVEKHLWADLIILQSPVYWFGNPWIYKKYVDEVFTAAMIQKSFLDGDGRTRSDLSKQYGSGGKLQGKKYMISLTWNAPEACFGSKDQFLFAGQTVDDVFTFNTANYKFCGAKILPSFSCYNVVKEPDIAGDIEKMRKHLSAVLEITKA